MVVRGNKHLMMLSSLHVASWACLPSLILEPHLKASGSSDCHLSYSGQAWLFLISSSKMRHRAEPFWNSSHVILGCGSHPTRPFAL